MPHMGFIINLAWVSKILEFVGLGTTKAYSNTLKVIQTKSNQL